MASDSNIASCSSGSPEVSCKSTILNTSKLYLSLFFYSFILLWKKVPHDGSSAGRGVSWINSIQKFKKSTIDAGCRSRANMLIKASSIILRFIHIHQTFIQCDLFLSSRCFFRPFQFFLLFMNLLVCIIMLRLQMLQKVGSVASSPLQMVQVGSFPSFPSAK